MPEMTIEQASDLASESATTFATMMSSNMGEQLQWFDEVHESMMARFIRKELAKGKT